MDEFQQVPDGNGYHRNERKCNILCVFFFTGSLLYQSKNYFTVSVVNPFYFFCLIEYCFSVNPWISTNGYHFISEYSILVIHNEISATLY